MRVLRLCAAGGAALVVAVVPAAPAAAQAPVPCSSIGGGHYNCHWWPAGDGHSGGALVVRDRTTVGFLHQGTNWIVCQQRGGDVYNSRGYRNYWFGWTTADNGQTGWASAIEARGGDNDGTFGGGVPDCNNAQPFLPTWSGEWGRPPAPSPGPTPTPGPPPPGGSPPGYVTATVSNAWSVTRRSTRLLRLRIHGATAGSTIRVFCRVHRCRLRRTTAAPDARGNATPTGLFGRRRLHVGTVVEGADHGAGLDREGRPLPDSARADPAGAGAVPAAGSDHSESLLSTAWACAASIQISQRPEAALRSS
jgi:hypothetical protein